jgi:hypothetical protein
MLTLRPWSFALLAAAVALGGCKKEEPAATGTEGKIEKKEPATGGAATDPLSKIAQKIESKVAALANAVKDDRKALTPAEYEQLILALEKCTMAERGIDFKCPEQKAYVQARSRNTALKDFAGMSSGLGLKHINHASPAVRWTAAGLLGGFFGASANVQEAVLKAIPEEKHPVVLAKLVGAVGSSASRNPKVGELLLKMADHESEVVRMEAISWLTTSFAKGLAGSADKVIEKVQKDPSPKVQAYACEYAGRLGDERLVPIYKKLTQKPGDDPAVYNACMRGLIDLWNSFMPTDTPPSQKAYKLSLARLRDKPRSKDRPPWMVMSSFGRVPKGPPAWYKAKEVAKALGDVVLDGQANWMARAGAARALGELKDKEELEKLKTKLGAGGEEFGGKLVVKAVEEALAKAQ